MNKRKRVGDPATGSIRDSNLYKEILRLSAYNLGPPPVAYAEELAGQPVNMARYMAQLCTWLGARAKLPGAEGKNARAEIMRTWRAWNGVSPRKNQAAAVCEFATIIFDHAARTEHDPKSLQRASRSVIVMFGVTFPELAASLDESLVEQALIRASVDARVDKGPSKWTAIAEAYNSSGDTTTADAARKAFEAKEAEK